MSLLNLIHLIAMEPTTLSSSLCLSSNKRNWNTANNFNNEVISPLFGFSIFAVCSIMAKKGNQWIVSFIEVVQYKSLSWRSISFLAECLCTLASILFSYASALRLSLHYWVNAGLLKSSHNGSIYVMEVLFMIYSLSLYSVWI